MKKLYYIIPFLFFSGRLMAQEAAATAEPVLPPSGGGSMLMNLMIVVFIIAALVMLIVSLVLLKTFKVLSNELLNPTPFVERPTEKVLDYDEWLLHKKNTTEKKPGFFTKVMGLRPVSEEKDIMMDHEFDGIAELDNPTPAWFMWLFYVTILFAGVYLLNYHVFNWSPLQDEEYAIEVTQADAAKEAYLAKAANQVDETTVKESKEPAVLGSGMAVFNANCVACHGDKGQGGVGPNMTDEYWLHGGSVNSVFKTIKYGVPEKGMISWEKTLTPKQISDVTNYILSLKGSNPSGAKEPQGEKEEG